MWRDLIIVLALIGLYSNFDSARSEELNEENYSTYEYKQIFLGIPSFFEYLLNAVEEHPDILEKNDVTVFKRATEEINVIGANEKRSVQSDQEKKFVENDDKFEQNRDIDSVVGVESTDSEVNEIGVTHGFKDTSTEAYEYANIMLMIGSKEDICEMKLSREVIHVERVELHKDEQVKRKQRKHNTDENLFRENDDVDWNKADSYPGLRNFFSLDITPEEIEERHIMTERLLEDYNKNKLKMN